MMKNPLSDPLPSYSESLQSNPSHQPLSTSLTQTRQHLISTLLTTHIHPHMHFAASRGLSKTILILVPSNVTALHPPPSSSPSPDPDTYRNPFDNNNNNKENSETFPGEKIINFPSTENPSITRLHDPANTLEFWRQAPVILALQTQLRTELQASGHRPSVDDEDGDNPVRAGRRFVEEAAVRKGEIRARASIGDVSLRIENAMGLYETRGGKAIVVRVEVGG